MRKTKQRETERECVRVSELKGQERVGGKEKETTKTKHEGGKNSASEKKRGRRTEKESTLGIKG